MTSSEERSATAQAVSVSLSREHRPQALLLSFLGALLLERPGQPVSAAILLRLLADLDVAEHTARPTLSRMSQRGLLERHRTGREVAFTLTDFGEQLLCRGRHRVHSEHPFEHADDEWTLLSYSMPESRRDLRHQIRATLSWAGFGGLRDGLWIAPGTVDVNRILAEADLDGAAGLADWFAARPLPGTDIQAMIRRAWDLDQIEAEHRWFAQRWATLRPGLDAIGQVTVMGADWLRLLRADPGLPAAHLGSDWPAVQSTAVRLRHFAALQREAQDLLDLRLAGRA